MSEAFNYTAQAKAASRAAREPESDLARWVAQTPEDAASERSSGARALLLRLPAIPLAERRSREDDQ